MCRGERRKGLDACATLCIHSMFAIRCTFVVCDAFVGQIRLELWVRSTLVIDAKGQETVGVSHHFTRAVDSSGNKMVA